MATIAAAKTQVLGYSGATDIWVVADIPLNIYDMWVTNQDVDTRYLMAFNRSTSPSNGTAPDYTAAVASGLTAGHCFPQGVYFKNGMVLALSSTPDTLTVTTGSQGVFGVLINSFLVE